LNVFVRGGAEGFASASGADKVPDCCGTRAVCEHWFLSHFAEDPLHEAVLNQELLLSCKRSQLSVASAGSKR
jgi:hypothetical protein